jgi:hypothetical protein
MEIAVPKNLLRSQREASAMYAPEYRYDRNDIYIHFSDRLDILFDRVVINYICIEVNCNPDFDW